MKILVSSQNCSENINASLVLQLNDTHFKLSFSNYSYRLFGQYKDNTIDLYIQERIMVFYCVLRRFVNVRIKDKGRRYKSLIISSSLFAK